MATHNILRRLAGVACVAAAALSLGLATGAPAQADTTPAKVNVGAGVAFGKGTVFVNNSVKQENFCTIGAVGRDPQGRLLAITAGHCSVESIAPFATIDSIWVQGQKVGTIAGRYKTDSLGGVTPGFYDFAFYYLDESKVTIGSERGANVSGGLPAADFHALTFSTVCISGSTSGQRCGGYIGDGGTNPRTHLLGFGVQSGDSGGPLYTTDGKLLGIGSLGGPIGQTGVNSPFAYYADVRDSISYAVAHNFITGFTPIA